MRKIIVPVDFSNCSKDAFLFARELAREFFASIMVIHINSNGANLSSTPDEDKEQDSIDSAKEKLEQFIGQMPEQKLGILSNDVKITSVALSGYVVSEIIKFAASENAFMIIMGTTGCHSALEKAIGSISTGVAQRAQCPVLLVPRNTKYQPFQNILFATDFQSQDEALLNRNIEFANTFRSAMHFVHVDDGSQNDYEKVENEIFEMLFKGGEPSFAFNLATVPNPSISMGLNQYAERNNIDLMILLNHRQSFLDNVMGRSTTKEVALNTKTPLMVYPVEEAHRTS